MKIDFNKNNDNLVPAVIQDFETKTVLMLGYMNEEAYKKTQETKRVTFYSRSKKRLWTKGEDSGNFLNLKSIKVDCDNDALLISVKPSGPVCHQKTDTCWGEVNKPNYGFLSSLENVIQDRIENFNKEDSYVASLYDKGLNKVAQKVGEEAVEMLIEAKDNKDELFLNESADLLFHYLILLRTKGFSFQDVINILESRKN